MGDPIYFETVINIVVDTLNRGGDIWIAEAGQSDFSADTLRQVSLKLPNINTKERIHIVQHSDWNEESTNPTGYSDTRTYSMSVSFLIDLTPSKIVKPHPPRKSKTRIAVKPPTEKSLKAMS